MPENRGVHAPYNFVPFSDEILYPYASRRELPGHNCLQEGLKTGKILVKMRAETPVFVSDGEKNNPHFSRGSNGKIVIPGSTVRGMARENMQILGFGHVHPQKDLEGLFAEGLPACHKVVKGEANSPIDYPCAILGFVTAEPSTRFSYRSRVNFEDFEVVGHSGELGEIPMILSGPKPKYRLGYMIPGKSSGFMRSDKRAEKNSSRPRGYKQYWLKQEEVPFVPRGREKVASVLRPLPTGTEFKGIIRFRNLTENELGLLLWTLCLEKGCFQTIGKGKPYGYGRMKVAVEALHVVNPKGLYGADLTGDAWLDETELVYRYIDLYDQNALKISKKKTGRIREQPEIQDFFFIKRSIRNRRDVSYMNLREYKSIKQPLPLIADFRKEEQPGKRNQER